jgi:hypothetical protein
MGKSNSQGAGNGQSVSGPMGKEQANSGWDFRKVSFFDFVEGRRPA